MDILTVIGLILGFGAILGGQYLEGGSPSTLVNAPAALIVLGGTLGAVMLQSPLTTFMRGLRMIPWAFVPPRLAPDEAIEKIIDWSNTARKEGLLGLESISETEADPFARKGLQLLVDGSEPQVLRAILEVEVDTKETADLAAAKVFESMGGYSPTIGIIGAVMGLIQVMNNLSDPSKLGHGIAVAFVATIYGVGFANLLYLPLANKLRSTIQAQAQFHYMVIEGIVSIAEGENPRNIETKLQGYLH
jgi:chemotaxis protein MotA